jgi:hypothetical protein
MIVFMVLLHHRSNGLDAEAQRTDDIPSYTAFGPLARVRETRSGEAWLEARLSAA